MPPMLLRTVDARRYVTPLREGGSLPAIVEGDDAGLYVLKFRGAGQGPKALIAELLAGEIGRALGLQYPRDRAHDAGSGPGAHRAGYRDPGTDPRQRGTEPRADYLPGSVTFDPVAWRRMPDLASRIVWFDALRHQRRSHARRT